MHETVISLTCSSDVPRNKIGGDIIVRCVFNVYGFVHVTLSGGFSYNDNLFSFDFKHKHLKGLNKYMIELKGEFDVISKC